MRHSLGRDFGYLWAAFAASSAGTWLAFDAFPLIAVLVLHSGTAQVSMLAAVGLTAGALVAVLLGPWVEFHRKRPVMIGMDLLRFLALLSLPAAYALGGLGFTQLLVVSMIVSAGDIVFAAASGAYLKSLVRPDRLVAATARFEATQWTTTMIGPPLGGAAIATLGPLATVLVNAISFVVSALGIRAIGGGEPSSPARNARRLGTGDILEGWRYILRHPHLRPLFFNTSLVNGLIMATAPLLTVLLVRDLGFATWQYGLAFGAPCIGGLIGSRFAQPLVARFGRHRVMLTSGILRACWLLGLAFVGPGPGGLVLVIAVEFGLITCMGVFNPLFAAFRLEQTTPDRIARTLSAWSITSKATIAALTVCWGLLAGITGPRTAIAIAGVLILATPLLLPRRRAVSEVREGVPHNGPDVGIPSGGVADGIPVRSGVEETVRGDEGGLGG